MFCFVHNSEAVENRISNQFPDGESPDEINDSYGITRKFLNPPGFQNYQLQSGEIAVAWWKLPGAYKPKAWQRVLGRNPRRREVAWSV
jgi:hypothetical protein